MTRAEAIHLLKKAVALAHEKTIRLDKEADWVCWECTGYWKYYDKPRHEKGCRLAALETAAGFVPTGPDGTPFEEGV